MSNELLKIGKKLGVFISIEKLYPKSFLSWLDKWADLRKHKEFSNNGKYTEWGLGYKQAVRDIKKRLEYYPNGLINISNSKDYRYCPNCHTEDKKGYMGKVCSFCATKLTNDPLDLIFVKDAKSEQGEKK